MQNQKKTRKKAAQQSSEFNDKAEFKSKLAKYSEFPKYAIDGTPKLEAAIKKTLPVIPPPKKITVSLFTAVDGYQYDALCRKPQKVERKDFEHVPESYFPVYIRYTASDGAFERTIFNNKEEFDEWYTSLPDTRNHRPYVLGCIPDKVDELGEEVCALYDAVNIAVHDIEDPSALIDRYLRAAIVGHNYLLSQLRKAANADDNGEEHAAYNAIVTRNPLKFPSDV